MNDSKPKQDPEPASDSEPTRDSEPTATEELVKAAGHLRKAASAFIDRVARDSRVQHATAKADQVAGKIDPAVRAATREAERMVQKLRDAANPIARHAVDELADLTRDAERTLEQLKDTASPVARQLSQDLVKLKDKLGAALRDAEPSPAEKPEPSSDDAP